MDFAVKQVFFFVFCNSSPTCRGRRILAIYYVKKKFGMSPKNYKTHKEMMDKYNEKQIDDPV